MLVLVCLVASTYFIGMGRRWFHPTRTILFDVRRACDDSDSKYVLICCLAIGWSLSSCVLHNVDLLEFWKMRQHIVISCWFGIVGSRCPNHAGLFVS